MKLFAWVGEDEFGSGVVGLKQALVPAGLVPLVAIEQAKIDHGDIVAMLQAQADTYGKTIRLIECTEVATVRVIRPRPQG